MHRPTLYMKGCGEEAKCQKTIPFFGRPCQTHRSPAMSHIHTCVCSDLHISVCVYVYVGLAVLRLTRKHIQHACKPFVERERYLSSELSSESSQLTVEATVGVLHMLRVRPAHNLKVVLGLSPV